MPCLIVNVCCFVFFSKAPGKISGIFLTVKILMAAVPYALEEFNKVKPYGSYLGRHLKLFKPLKARIVGSG